jgi:8-oxo-dGTP pyrophosphatase MutT (NUDIX family)
MKIYKSAKILIFDAAKNVLVLRRSDTHPWAPLSPDLPGGWIHDDEEFAEGVQRELHEETGMIIPTDKFRVLYEVSDINTRGDHMNRKVYGADIKAIKPDIILSWEHDSFEWIRLEDVKGIEPSNQKAINTILASQR